MTDPMQTTPDIDSPAELPIQPTGSGAADLEIARLQAAVEEGVEDPTITTPVPDDGTTPLPM